MLLPGRNIAHRTTRLRARKIEVHLVAPEKRPMERVLGPAMGDFLRALHEEHGVVFHLEDTVVAIEGQRATLMAARLKLAPWLPVSASGRGWRWLSLDDDEKELGQRAHIAGERETRT